MPPCPTSLGAELVGDAEVAERRAAVVATGQIEQAGWWGPGRVVDWSDMVAAVETVAATLAVPVVVTSDSDHAPWHPGRCARISLEDGTLVGHAGELHPKVLAALELPARTVAAEPTAPMASKYSWWASTTRTTSMSSRISTPLRSASPSRTISLRPHA